MADVPDALAEVGRAAHPGLSESSLLLGDDFRSFLAEITEAQETGSDPDAFWAKSIDVVYERARTKAEGPDGLA